MDFNTAKQIAKRILGSTIRRSPDGSGFVVQDKQKQPVESSQITPTEAKKKELIPKSKMNTDDESSRAPAQQSATVQRMTVGLDFGTAFTKVVVWGRAPHVIKLRDQVSHGEEFLLPTEIWWTEKGEYSLTKLNDGQRARDLKKRILLDKLDDESKYRIVAYLAFVFVRTRNWIKENKQDIYFNRGFDWYLNVGLPTSTYNNEKLEKLYCDLISAAWLLSDDDHRISKESVIDALQGRSARDLEAGKIGISKEKIHAFPEFVAQVTGYVRSSSRRRGIHLLVDVGAGTVDSTIFNVHRQDYEDKHPIFDSSVTYTGAESLVLHRLDEPGYSGDWEPSVDAPIPSREFFSEKMGIPIKRIIEAEKNLEEEVYLPIAKMINYTKSEMAPIQAEWTTGVPLFLTGGGSAIDFYQEITASVCNNWKAQNIHIEGSQLPKPQDLDADKLPTEYFHRLSVAYGLAHGALDIGTITNLRPFQNRSRNRPGAAESCPQCQGTGGGYGNCLKCGGSGWLN